MQAVVLAHNTKATDLNKKQKWPNVCGHAVAWKGALSKISQAEEDFFLFQQHKAKIYKQKVCLNVWKAQVSPLF